MKPLVSIIIPTYNRGSRVKDTIHSMTNQSYKNIEIIVIDDGSTDNTKNIIQSIKDTRIKYIKTINRGVAQARNRGLREAKGKYITFCDDDDLYKENKIKHQLNYLESNPKLGFCFCNTIISYTDKRFPFLKNKPKANFINLLLSDNFILTPCIMIRKKILKKDCQFNKIFQPVEDYDMWLQLSSNNDFGYMDNILVVVNKCNDSLSSDNRLTSAKISAVKLKYLKKLNQSNYKKEANLIQWSIYFHSSKQKHFKGDNKSALKYLLKAIRINTLQPKNYFVLLLIIINNNNIENKLLNLYSDLRN